MEERLRSHYSTVLEHMEAQLAMALQLQDDADRYCVCMHFIENFVSIVGNSTLHVISCCIM